MSRSASDTVGIVGLGYVGLPLAVAFGQELPTVAFDIDVERVAELRAGVDRNRETSSQALRSEHLQFTTAVEDLVAADFFVVAVPTPVDAANQPDLAALRGATRTVGRALRDRIPHNGDRDRPIVVFESTVYPGCTEEVCLPILEEASGGRLGRDFGLGYSPERINPGDFEHGLASVIKIVSGSDPEIQERVAHTYEMVAKSGVYRAPNIRTAEAAKVIENVQRDLNIALMNELALLFHPLGLDTREVLKAAGTKWNFLRFEPGLVGGHCIPVDPYYLTYWALGSGFHPEVILAGRRTNDSMGQFIAHETVKLLIQSGRPIRNGRVLVLGGTFKPDVPDLRNSRVEDLLKELQSYGIEVTIHDPEAEPEALKRFGAPVIETIPREGGYDCIVLAVPHRAFREWPLQSFLDLFRSADGPGVLMDVKGVLDHEAVVAKGHLYWRL